uniref:Recep_L_domain domain-containing protein n=1 Tax=Caenorhabditis tropicalis TaxID=1561998 RepID=A0A1I7UJV9_9PELO
MKTAVCLLLFFTVNCQKISGDVGNEMEIQSDIVTIDPNPFNIPTINWDDILKNIPTVPPLVLPTLDPNFWQNLPTLPTIPPLVFPTPTPRTSQCTYKLNQEILSNETFSNSLNYTNSQSVVDALIVQSVSVCNGFQTQKLTDLSNKYGVLITDVQDIVPYFSTSDLRKLTLSILQGDSGQVFNLFFSKTLENLTNPTVTLKLSKASSQISMLQFDLLLNPI